MVTSWLSLDGHVVFQLKKGEEDAMQSKQDMKELQCEKQKEKFWNLMYLENSEGTWAEERRKILAKDDDREKLDMKSQKFNYLPRSAI